MSKKLPSPQEMEELRKKRNLFQGLESILTDEFLTHVVQNADFDPVTGKYTSDHEKTLQYISSKQGTSWHKNLVVTENSEKEKIKSTDVTTVDLSSLPSIPETWTLELHDNIDWQLEIDGKTCITKQWLMACDNPVTPRLVRASRIKPTDDEVMAFIRESFANVGSMFKPGLPTLLLVAPAYKSYRPILRPFFDSLPRPFSWKFDSGPRTQGSNKVGLVIDVLINVGQGWKTTGNEAYAKKDIALALESYTHGIEHLDYTLKEYGLKMKLDKSDTVRKLLAVFLANRAAVYLWDSKEFSPQKAEEDGRRSEDADPAYAKAYYRQARAHECLGDIAKARNVLNRALRREELKNDTGVRQELDKYLMMAM